MSLAPNVSISEREKNRKTRTQNPKIGQSFIL